MYCKHCYRMMDDGADICPACGKSQKEKVKKPIGKGLRILLGIATWFVAMLAVGIIGTALKLPGGLYSVLVLVVPVLIAFKVAAPEKMKFKAPQKPASAKPITVIDPTPEKVDPEQDQKVQAIVKSLHDGTFKETIQELYGESYTESEDDEPIVSEPDTIATQQSTDAIKPLPQVKRSNPKAYTLPVFNLDFIRQCRKCFISFDVETTGFDASVDQIIEISAVRFENFKAIDSFSTLVNPHMHIPSAASKVNHIYDNDVALAPDLEQVIPKLCEFLGENALDGSVELVAHNAIFDIKFLLHALARCGIDADISFQDTLFMCREAALGLENNKLGTVAKHFNIQQRQGHRAEDDACVCGEIFIKLLSAREDQLNNLMSELNDTEVDICKWLKSIFEEADLNTQFLHFHSGTYLSCICVYDVVKFKTRARTPYILIKKDYQLPVGAETSATSKAEGEKYIRFLFHEVSDLVPLKDYFVKRYRETYASAERFFSSSDKNLKEAARQVNKHISI